MSNFNNLEIGQVVKIVGDSFVNDIHGFDEGTLGIVEELVPATSFEDLPPFVQFIYALDGQEGINLPARVHISIIDEDNDQFEEPRFANVLPEDLEPVEEKVIDQVELLEDDLADGFIAGDVFAVYTDDNGEYYFLDREGDERLLEAFEYRIVD